MDIEKLVNDKEKTCSSCNLDLDKDGRCYNKECDEYDPLSQYFDGDNSVIEDNKSSYGLLAWQLNEIIESMNNEEAYYGSWLYVWPDGTSKKEVMNIFSSKAAYNELEDWFIDIYKEFHSDGLYKATSDIVAKAHAWDEKLGLPKIEAYNTINVLVEKQILIESPVELNQRVRIKTENPDSVWNGLSGTVEGIDGDEDTNWVIVLVDFPTEDGDIRAVRQTFEEKELVTIE